MPFVVGETIGPYRILEQLGRGGMATVFKAYHAALDRYVAIKALHPAFMEDPNFLARFQREARVVAKLEHPNIVPIYDFAEYEGRPYLVMKYIEGETLKARITAGTLGQDELIQIVEAVGAGLSYAHQKGILHRDVKPSNVLLGYDGRVYLADFGLARIAQAGESTLSSDMMLGTPQYISPEQAMGLGELDERTDIYSFGVMLYEMAVGKVPFSADTPFSIIHDHIYTPLPLPRTVNPDVSEPVERVLLKALAKEREDRYPDANALSSAFEQAVLADPGAAPVVVAPTPEQTFVPEPEPAPQVAESISAAVATETVIPTPVVTGDETPILEMDEVQPISASPPPKKKKRRFRWWFIPLGIVLIIACCFCSLVGYEMFSEYSDIGDPSAEQLPEGPPPEPFQERQPPPLDAPLLDEVQHQVAENPKDPWLHLELYSAYLEFGMGVEAEGALQQALQLSADDPEVSSTAGDIAAAYGLWLQAAQLYARTAKLHQGDVPSELPEKLIEAMYYGAAEPGAPDVFAELEPALLQGERDHLRDAYRDALIARYKLYYEDADEAKAIIEDVVMRAPNLDLARLVQAEIYLFTDDIPRSEMILLELRGSPTLHPWMHQEIIIILEEINPDS